METIEIETKQVMENMKAVLEAAGYEVLVFHATGTGGRIMESLIESGLVSGVLDVTTTEWADELVGGILGAGPTRLEAAGKMKVPAVVAPGAATSLRTRLRAEFLTQVWPPVAAQMRRLDIDPATLIDGIDA